MDKEAKKFRQEISATWTAEICMCGDYDRAKSIIQEEADKGGLCVTITKSDYIYKWGEEEGFIVRLINYPRFPESPDEIEQRALKLAHILLKNLWQESFCVICPDKTIWYTIRESNF